MQPKYVIVKQRDVCEEKGTQIIVCTTKRRNMLTVH